MTGSGHSGGLICEFSVNHYLRMLVKTEQLTIRVEDQNLYCVRLEMI